MKRINIKHKGLMIAIVFLLILVSIYMLPYLVVRHELKAPKAAVFDAKALMHDEVSALANTSLGSETKKRLSACMAHLTAQALKKYTRDTGNVILKPDQAVFGAIDITTSIKTQVINAITAGACDDFKPHQSNKRKST